MVITTCPTRRVLEQYTVGKLSDEQSEQLADHLDSCPECQATILSLDSGDDTLIGRLRTPTASDSFLAEPECQAALAEAIAQAPARKGARGEALPQTIGEYQILGELGHGGMGVVYKALHTKLDRTVAVKILTRGRGNDPEAIDRFAREMRVVGRLEHPNIVRAHDAREIDGTPVLVMELVDGLDLSEIVRRIGPLPVAESCELVRQTAAALQYAHEHGLVHRDVKPSNVMLARTGEVKLLDLGLARFYAGMTPSDAGDEITGSGQAMGTADYMAPEQATDSRLVDIRADLYSLGCTLYKLVSGRSPFGGPEHRGTFEKMTAHAHEPAPPIGEVVPNVPGELAAILDRLLAKNPGDRFSTPSEVATAIAPFCTGADLPALFQRAEDAECPRLPLEEGRGEGSPAVRPSSPLRPPLLLDAWGWRWLLGQLALLLIVGGLGFVLGILITIKKDGQTYQVEAPDGSRTVVDEHGNTTLEIPIGEKSTPASIVNPAADFLALQGPWEVQHVDAGGIGDFSLNGFGGRSFSIAAVSRIDFGERGVDLAVIGQGLDAWLEYDIDPNSVPKSIEIRQQSVSDKPGELVARGIYEFDAGRLRICLVRQWPALKTDDGPKGFTIDPQSADILLTLKRYRLSADESALQGNWILIAEVEDGKPTSKETLRLPSTNRYLFSGSRAWWPGRESIGPSQYDCLLDPKAEPKAMTLIGWQYSVAASDVERATLLAIYKLADDRLTIAYRKNGPRPEAFESTPGSGVTLLELRRKSLELDAEADSTPPAVAPAADFQALQGPWEVAQVSTSKKMEYRDRIRRLDFHGGSLLMTYPELPKKEDFRYRIAPTKEPKCIELFSIAGDVDGLPSYLGIYELDGDRLQIALNWNNPVVKGVERPRGFEHDSADIVWELGRLQPSEAETALQGSWPVVQQTMDGKTISDLKLRNKSVYFRGDSFNGNLAYEKTDGIFDLSGTFIIVPDEVPSGITFYARSDPPDAPAWEAELPGIFKIEGDRLTIAFRKDGPRPERFESKPGSGVTLLELERDRPFEVPSAGKYGIE